jgi:hypothetical protein
VTVTMLTSGSEVCAAATAEFGSSHPARSGAMAANSNATRAGCVRNPVIEKLPPEFEFGHGLQFCAARWHAATIPSPLIRPG